MHSYSHIQYAWFATRYTTNIYILLQTSFFTTAVTVLLEYFDCLLRLYNCMRSTSQPSEPSLRVSLAVMYKNYTQRRFGSFHLVIFASIPGFITYRPKFSRTSGHFLNVNAGLADSFQLASGVLNQREGRSFIQTRIEASQKV